MRLDNLRPGARFRATNGERYKLVRLSPGAAYVQPTRGPLREVQGRTFRASAKLVAWSRAAEVEEVQ